MAYGQRTDLNVNRQPVRAASGQAYGERARQEAAQRALPLPAAQAVPTPQAGVGFRAEDLVFPENFVGAGDLGPLDRPTDRPGEPLTAGAPLGPGPGPEALSFTGSGRPADPDMEALRPYLATLELLASQPNTSPTARNFVRRLRGAMPPPSGS